MIHGWHCVMINMILRVMLMRNIVFLRSGMTQECPHLYTSMRLVLRAMLMRNISLFFMGQAWLTSALFFAPPCIWYWNLFFWETKILSCWLVNVLWTWFSHCDFKILFWRNLMLNSVTNAYPFLHSLIQLSVACLQKPFNFLVSQFNHNFTQFEALLFKTLPCWSFDFVTIFFLKQCL